MDTRWVVIGTTIGIVLTLFDEYTAGIVCFIGAVLIAAFIVWIIIGGFIDMVVSEMGGGR